ncbi:MAG: hypothetical protein KGL37_01500 [Acidobacteriota bacterium]|nr:hypothetical protein [Acidobacteriota bacterium]
MTLRRPQPKCGAPGQPRSAAYFWTAALLLAAFPGSVQAQMAAPQPISAQSVSPSSAMATETTVTKKPSDRDRRRAIKLYLASSKLFLAGKFEEAMRGYEQASTLDPANANYRLAAGVARSHAVTALIQAAAKDKLTGNSATATAALTRALQLDPQNVEVTQHLYELGNISGLNPERPTYEGPAETAGGPAQLAPASGVRSFEIRAGQRQVIQQVFKAYGLEAMLDDSVGTGQARLEMGDASFREAMRALSLLTGTFYVPIDERRVLVARDTPSNRQKFMRQELETVYLSGLSQTELTEVTNLAKNVFDVRSAVPDPSASTLTLRAPGTTLDAFNGTMRELLDGHNQVFLEVRLIQIAHTTTRNTGVQLPQSVSAFNVYAEEQSILNANQGLVQQIISSGLAAPGDTLAILGILLASGQVSSSLFSNGIALFGGGLTQSALSPGAATMNLNLNSSDSRELDQIQLRMQDGQPGTLRLGSRYPIMTSSFSSLSPSVPNIPGLTGAGASGSLSSLLASLTGAVPSVPQVQYQDLGLTLKATPNVTRSGDVALTLDLKLDALSGQFINAVPVLNNRAYSGVVTIKEGAAVVVASELDRQESRAISGTPGISEIPGLTDITNTTAEKDYATLLIVITPHVIRGTQAAGHSPMFRVVRGTAAR